MTAPPEPAWAVLAVAVLVGVGVPFSAAFTTSARPNAGGTPLSVTAELVDWTWYGSGTPCATGSNLTYVAHLDGSAHGGTPPYAFRWDFGDGSIQSTGANVSHVFRGAPPWNATLTVTDASGGTSASKLQVSPPAFSCPAMPAPGPIFGPQAGVSLALIALVLTLVGGIIVVAAYATSGKFLGPR